MKRNMFRASLLAMALMISLPAWAGTFIDNFDDGDYDRWEILDWARGVSEWKVEDGVLTCSRQIAESSLLIFGEEEWQNYSIEFDAKMVKTFANFNAIALDLRVSDIDYARSTCNSVWCGASKAGQAWIWAWIGLNAVGMSAKKAFTLQLDRWYRVKGVANGDNFELHIDGEPMASFSDSRFPAGRVALDVNGALVQFLTL